MAEPIQIALSEIDDHPERDEFYDQDVIDQIASELNGSFPERHAVTVRKKGDRYEMNNGHHRKRACEKKGITHIWAIVESMSDEEALIRLIADNKQSPRSPLQIGINALKYVQRSKGGAGKTGGLSEYARRIGQKQQHVSTYRSAAEVYLSIEKPTHQCVGFLDKAQHLDAIHKLPKACWEDATTALLKHGWSVVETKEHIDLMQKWREDTGIVEHWADVFLDPLKCIGRILIQETSPKYFARLSHNANKCYVGLEGHEDLQKQWCEWLTENAGGDSWNVSKLTEKRDELESTAWERDNSDDDGTRLEYVIHDDFRKVAETIEDGSVDLFLADPPYDTPSVPLYGDLARIAEAKLIDGGSLICYCGHRLIPKILKEMECLNFYWMCACIHTGNSVRMPLTGQIVGFKPLLWFIKGKERFNTSKFVEDTVHSVQEKDTHKWQQGVIDAKHFIEALSRKNRLVFDPFCGAGTTAIAALELERRIITCDVDEKAVQSATERISKFIST